MLPCSFPRPGRLLHPDIGPEGQALPNTALKEILVKEKTTLSPPSRLSTKVRKKQAKKAARRARQKAKWDKTQQAIDMKVVFTSDWMVTIFLCVLPILGLLITALYAFIPRTNPNRKYFARALLIWYFLIILVILAIIVGLYMIFDKSLIELIKPIIQSIQSLLK